MEIFLDSAKIQELQIASEKWPWIKGITTNPSLLAKSGVSDIFGFYVKICRLFPHRPVSFQVTSSHYRSMEKEARSIRENLSQKLSAEDLKQVTIKLPATEDGFRLCKHLSGQGVKTNITLVFTLPQALLAAECGATFCSCFLGRWDDKEQDPQAGLKKVAEMQTAYEKYGYSTKLLAASIRSLEHIHGLSLLGVPAATVPYSTIEQMPKHELTDAGVHRFEDDSSAFA